MHVQRTPNEPGMRVGSRENPDQYTLEHRIGVASAEGECWRARRVDRNGQVSWWMVKVLTAHKDDDDLRRWQSRWEDCVHDANRLAIGGLIAPLVLVGPAPHPPGAATKTLCSYLVSRWFDGCELREWAARGPDPLAAADVLVQLCSIVDRIHDSGWVHGDVSARNVMVGQDGSIQLIDLTFLHQAGRRRQTLVYSPGHVAPERELDMYLLTVEGERYAIGAVARTALLGRPTALPSAGGGADAQFRNELLQAGFSVEVAAHAARPLSDHPADRPRLLPWARRLAELLQAGGRPARHCCVDVLADGGDGLVVVAGGVAGLEYLRVPGPGRGTPDTLLPPFADAPRSLREVATRRTGTGQPVIAALDVVGTLHIGTATGWSKACDDAEGIAVTRSASGDVVVWTAHDRALYAVHCPAEGGELDIRPVTGSSASRVLAAAHDIDGSVGVLVEDSGALVCLRLHPGLDPVRETVPVGLTNRGSLALNRWGHLEAVLTRRDGQPVRAEQDTGIWELETLPDMNGVQDVTAVGHRGGPTLALAGPAGIRVLTHGAGGSEWHLLKDSASATRVRVAEGPGWRLCVAAVVDGTARLWFEKVTRNGWDRHAVLV
ncbi:serine/threonine-protein kinase [Streptomyces herbicida]|uniref:hypothetical protein n=1 Tax=Streptomyces herbicida TaxID=3065675 RepID=UPI0029303305|nr:hypothetical protein [Streptomyces sp. NEAU-HV9]